MKQVKNIQVKNQMGNIISCQPMRDMIIEANNENKTLLIIDDIPVNITKLTENEELFVIHVKVNYDG